MTTPDPFDEGRSIVSLGQFQRGAFAQIAAFYEGQQDYIADMLVTASQVCEEKCHKRFMPFTTTWTTTAQGVHPDRSSSGGGLTALPGGLVGDLTYPAAPPAAAGVRDFWLPHRAPQRPEDWSYRDVTVTATGPGSAPARVAVAVGPEPDTGHLVLAHGVRPGTEVAIAYSGGYDPYPAALTQAVRLLALRELIDELGPDMVPGATPNLDRLDRAIMHKLAPYGCHCICPQHAGGGGKR